jgi:hypothetical protein
LFSGTRFSVLKAHVRGVHLSDTEDNTFFTELDSNQTPVEHRVVRMVEQGNFKPNRGPQQRIRTLSFPYAWLKAPALQTTHKTGYSQAKIQRANARKSVSRKYQSAILFSTQTNQSTSFPTPNSNPSPRPQNTPLQPAIECNLPPDGSVQSELTIAPPATELTRPPLHVSSFSAPTNSQTPEGESLPTQQLILDPLHGNSQVLENSFNPQPATMHLLPVPQVASQAFTQPSESPNQSLGEREQRCLQSMLMLMQQSHPMPPIPDNCVQNDQELILFQQNQCPNLNPADVSMQHYQTLRQVPSFQMQYDHEAYQGQQFEFQS